MKNLRSITEKNPRRMSGKAQIGIPGGISVRISGLISEKKDIGRIPVEQKPGETPGEFQVGTSERFPEGAPEECPKETPGGFTE